MYFWLMPWLYRLFGRKEYRGKIGIVHSYTPVDGVDDRPETLKAMRYADNYCNNWVLDTAAKGEIPRTCWIN